jgi:hypothetical protein
VVELATARLDTNNATTSESRRRLRDTMEPPKQIVSPATFRGKDADEKCKGHAIAREFFYQRLQTLAVCGNGKVQTSAETVTRAMVRV